MHFAGAIDALMLLDQHIAPGCVLLFDDLINYPDYRDHEIKALWEWLDSTGRKVEVSYVIFPLGFRNPAEVLWVPSQDYPICKPAIPSADVACTCQLGCASGKLWCFTVSVKVQLVTARLALVAVNAVDVVMAHVHPEVCLQMQICRAACYPGALLPSDVMLHLSNRSCSGNLLDT